MMDYENMGSAPDIDAIDPTKLDFGNDPEAVAKKPAEAPAQADLEAEVAAANGETEGKEGKPKGETEGEDDQARDEKGRFTGKGVIPIDRHKATLDKEREAREAAERRAAELERQLQAAATQKDVAQQTAETEAEIESLETKYQELLLDGNTKEAGQVMRQIRLMERQIATTQAEARATQRTAQTLESERLEVSIARLEADHPEFNPESDSYDPDLVALVIAKQNALIADGMTPSKAMAKAGEDVAKRFLAKAEPAEEAKGLAKGAKSDRQQQAVEKALAASKAQPASMKDAGLDSDKAGDKGLPDVTKMTADEFAALPKATQDRLMGNLV